MKTIRIYGVFFKGDDLPMYIGLKKWECIDFLKANKNWKRRFEIRLLKMVKGEKI